jgi:hypothetical protein
MNHVLKLKHLPQSVKGKSCTSVYDRQSSGMCCQGVWFTGQMFHSNLLCTSSGQNEDRAVGDSQKWYQSTTPHGITPQMTTILTIQLLQ